MSIIQSLYIDFDNDNNDDDNFISCQLSTVVRI